MDPDQGPGAELWGGSGRIVKIRESQGEEMACAMAGRPGAQDAYGEGQFGWWAGISGETGGDSRVLKSSPISDTQSWSWEGREDLLRVTEQGDTIRAGLRIIWNLL